MWRYWQLLVNGEPCDSYADGYELRAGDAVTWYHAAFGEELPNEDGFVVSPDAPRPDWEAFWPGFASGAASTQAPTPAGEAQEAMGVRFEGPLRLRHVRLRPPCR